MKRLLLPLLAAIALPTAVNSEGFNEKEIDAMIKEICYKDYGYVEATKKSLNLKISAESFLSTFVTNLLILPRV